MSGKSLNRGFRCLNCTIKSLTPAQRTFATSSVHRKHGAVPAFTPTSNPELDDLLSTMRNKIFLPSHLSKSQQDLITKDKYQRVLNIEPVIATIQGEEFQLEHIDPVKDIPDGRRSLTKAMALMKEKSDWDNLPSILTGLKDAKRTLRFQEWLKITRKAGIAGRPDIIIECARRVSSTGFRLGSAGIVMELMWQLQNKAIKSDWAPKETKQALAWAEAVSSLLEDYRHAGGKVVNAQEDPRVRPEVIGVLLQLSAVWATRYYDGEDRDGKVALYTARLLGSPAEITADPDQFRSELDGASIYMAYKAPILQGMKLALSILDAESKELELKVEELEIALAPHKAVLLAEGTNSEGRPVRGLQVYNELLGPEAKKVASTARRHKTSQETATVA